MGIGAALMEHTVYDRRTARPVTDNLADYAVPVHADAPADRGLLHRPARPAHQHPRLPGGRRAVDHRRRRRRRQRRPSCHRPAHARPADHTGQTAVEFASGRRHPCQPAPIRTCPRRAVARRPRHAVRPAPRLPARPRQGADVLRHVHAVARGGEADPRPTREPAVHSRDGALLELHGRADHPRQRPAASPARAASPSASTWPTTSTPTSSPTPRTASPSAPARSSWSSCAPRPPSGRASPRRSAPSSPRTPTPSGSSKRPSRSRPASPARPSSRSRRSSSPTPRA